VGPVEARVALPIGGGQTWGWPLLDDRTLLLPALDESVGNRLSTGLHHVVYDLMIHQAVALEVRWNARLLVFWPRAKPVLVSHPTYEGYFEGEDLPPSTSRTIANAQRHGSG